MTHQRLAALEARLIQQRDAVDDAYQRAVEQAFSADELAILADPALDMRRLRRRAGPPLTDAERQLCARYRDWWQEPAMQPLLARAAWLTLAIDLSAAERRPA